LLIHFVKFFHLLFALGLLSIVMRSAMLTGPERSQTRRDNVMIGLALLAMMTGTLLVYPKHFTFHTPWIQAAYLLVTLFCVAVIGLIYLKKQHVSRLWLINLSYFALAILLLLVIHDAVTKTTFLFGGNYVKLSTI
jgi:hypothetical protein